MNIHLSNYVFILANVYVNVVSHTKNSIVVSFTGLPTIQFLIASSIQKMQVNKNWMVERPRNKATSLYMYQRVGRLSM